MRPVLAPGGAAGGHPAPVLTKEQRERLEKVAAGSHEAAAEYESAPAWAIQASVRREYAAAITAALAYIDALEAERDLARQESAAAWKKLNGSVDAGMGEVVAALARESDVSVLRAERDALEARLAAEQEAANTNADMWSRRHQIALDERDAALARVAELEHELDVQREAVKACGECGIEHAKHKAVLAAECRAWRAHYAYTTRFHCNGYSMAHAAELAAVRHEARAATDAAGALEGGSHAEWCAMKQGTHEASCDCGGKS